MSSFTFEEYADIHYTYGLADGNGSKARRIYMEKYPTRKLPDARTFQRVHHRLRETGTVLQTQRGGRPTRLDPIQEEDVLEAVENDPSTSTRKLAAEFRLSHSKIWKILNQNSFHPFHLLKVQTLLERDYQPRIDFCNWFMNKIRHDANFSKFVLFTDEANFDKDGIMNSHNMHIWDIDNPHGVTNRKTQHKFSLNVWCGIINDTLLGPVFLPPRLSGHSYLEFLRNTLPTLLDDVPLLILHRMIFMHDGAPAHFSTDVRTYLNTNYPLRWIGRGGPISWPPRSPDLNPLDFYLWGHLKNLVYSTEVNDIEDLRRRIILHCQEIKQKVDTFPKIRRSLQRRLETCIEENGKHFEQFL